MHWYLDYVLDFFLPIHYTATTHKHYSCAAYEETHFLWSMLEISKTVFKVTLCINSNKYFIIQLMHSII